MVDEKNFSEGIMLGLGALSEQLQKSNSINESLIKRFLKEDEAAEAKKREEEEEKAAEEAENRVVEKVAKAVMKQLMDLNADKVVNVAGRTKWPMSSNPPGEDQEQAAKLRAATNEVQKPIQAHDITAAPVAPDIASVPPISEEMAETEEERKRKEMEAAEYPKKENVPVPMKEDEMYKQFVEMKSKLEKMEKGISEEIKKGVADTLRKAGWAESTGMPKPSVRSLGVDEMPISKSEENPVDALAKLSWLQIADLKTKADAGDTEGFPSVLKTR